MEHQHPGSSTTPNPTGTRQRFHALLFPRISLVIKSSSQPILLFNAIPFQPLLLHLPPGSPNCLLLNVDSSPLYILLNAIPRRYSFSICNLTAYFSLALMAANAITVARSPGSSVLPDGNNWFSMLAQLTDGIDAKHHSVVRRRHLHLLHYIVTSSRRSSIYAFTAPSNSTWTATVPSPTCKTYVISFPNAGNADFLSTMAAAHLVIARSTLVHVKSHQDDTTEFDDLPFLAQLKIMCDTMATNQLQCQKTLPLECSRACPLMPCNLPVEISYRCQVISSHYVSTLCNKIGFARHRLNKPPCSTELCNSRFLTEYWAEL